jgi:hypothetical protein
MDAGTAERAKGFLGGDLRAIGCREEEGQPEGAESRV